ncbi:MAG: prepilin peptidase [Firmicutes bacterium]|nr:prepilin peptidase [Bacillota bacterium]
MYFSILLLFFVLGTIFGSFYNVVGYRVPKGESLLYPSSHCTKCNHKLGSLELIPVLSFLLLGGKCKNCKDKISWFYPIFEFTSGILFALSYAVYGFSLECLLSIVFISMLLIIIISDYQTMIIPDSVLIVFSAMIILIKFFIVGINGVGISLLHALGSFIFMLLLKLFGDFLFKKESMGGGDIKLLAVFGLMFGFPMSMVSVFMSAIIGLPISLIVLKKNSSHEIPFGPFLAIAAILIVLLKLDINTILNLLTI